MNHLKKSYPHTRLNRVKVMCQAYFGIFRAFYYLKTVLWSSAVGILLAVSFLQSRSFSSIVGPLLVSFWMSAEEGLCDFGERGSK